MAQNRRVSPADVYVNALSFIAAVTALNRSDADGVDKILLYTPTVVCEAFALELFIKCLHEIRGTTPERNHDVETLFNALGQPDRDTISKYFDEIIQVHPEEL